MDNVVGTANILDFARNIDSLERFAYFSTDEVFGPAPAGVNYKENDRYNSTNPYSASKAGAEELVVAYENTYNLPCFITHTMNVFGERQSPEKFIPMVIKRVRDNEMVEIHQIQKKPWLVQDIIFMLKMLLMLYFFYLIMTYHQSLQIVLVLSAKNSILLEKMKLIIYLLLSLLPKFKTKS